ncbi:prepilin-type N-terminal cleavage/methylation domain-containing protein [Lentisphaera profundi]|uniref:Prepilin-type N-terminal cleavage/methylation domain-containing protein n=1 Tax=Lentisphaera profundi TaxID=1658616 RepID=A0ABY7VXH2_9BACT|nr:H-X9-DG-CTERM domain-containing protein [Lentisphaera profundi]WDE98928.1 prepilin-type N-terminal cleavage/methylation domain-containing protein [Lentisphaera profundi]
MRKFTLIELLVVVAIIGILSSLLLPTLGKARDKGKAAVCLSNLKQLGFAFNMYAENNNFFAPFTSRDGGGRNTWDDYLSGYDGRDAVANLNDGAYAKSVLGESYAAVYRCPSDDVKRDLWGNTDVVGRSYSITQMVPGDGNPRFLGMSSGTETRNFGDLSKPSKTITLIEYHDTLNALSQGAGDDRRVIQYKGKDDIGETPHDGKANFLMADGHVAKYTFLQTLQKSDGSIASTSDIRNTIWDASK